MVSPALSSRVHDLGLVADAAEALLGEVALHYPWPDRQHDSSTGHRWIRSNFVATVDGAAQGPDGRSGTINTDADHIVFDALRATCDVVVAGAGTVRREGYRAIDLTPAQQQVRDTATGAVPALLIVSGSLDLPADVAEGTGPVHVITGSACSQHSVDALRDRGITVHRTDLPRVSPAAVVALCRSQGWSRILVEGGPHLHGEMLAAGFLDEICLSVAPHVVGDTGLGIVAGAALRPPADFTVASVLLLDQTIMTRWARVTPVTEEAG